MSFFTYFSADALITEDPVIHDQASPALQKAVRCSRTWARRLEPVFAPCRCQQDGHHRLRRSSGGLVVPRNLSQFIRGPDRARESHRAFSVLYPTRNYQPHLLIEALNTRASPSRAPGSDPAQKRQVFGLPASAGRGVSSGPQLCEAAIFRIIGEIADATPSVAELIGAHRGKDPIARVHIIKQSAGRAQHPVSAYRAERICAILTTHSEAPCPRLQRMMCRSISSASVALRKDPESTFRTCDRCPSSGQSSVHDPLPDSISRTGRERRPLAGSVKSQRSGIAKSV